MRVKRSCGANKVYLEKSSTLEVLEACWELDELKYGIKKPEKRQSTGIKPMTSIRQMDMENEKQHDKKEISGINRLKKYIGINVGFN